jgi:hypothetical protein
MRKRLLIAVTAIAGALFVGFIAFRAFANRRSRR